MRTLYLECSMGASGDMLLGALSELLDPPQRTEFFETMNQLGLPGVQVTRRDAETCGIRGSHVSVRVGGVEEVSEDVHLHAGHCAHPAHGQEHGHHHGHGEGHFHTDPAGEGDSHTHEGHTEEHHRHHHHTSLADVEALVQGMPVPAAVKRDVRQVYALIAEAEAHAHGCEVGQIHFHEVGQLDAITDITGVCLLMHLLAPGQVAASPVHVGSGHVHCAHGVLPVPAPATAYLLRGVPAYSGQIQGELCTPTGAALLKHFVGQFGPMPVLAAEKIGYGLGSKDFGVANCLRAYLGEGEGSLPRVAQLCCNLDDMTGESIGFAVNRLLDEGALDVFTTPIQMKKNRPGVLLTCLCGEEEAERFAQLLLTHTSTLGVRKTLCERYVMQRAQRTVDTEYGALRVKCAKGYGAEKAKVEYEDAARAAATFGVSYSQVERAVQRALQK